MHNYFREFKASIDLEENSFAYKEKKLYVSKNIPFYDHMTAPLQSPQQEDWDSSTVCSALKHFERLVETTRMTLLGPGCRETLTSAIETVVERTQDFTDSAYTSHEHRENILLLCDRAKLELNTLLRIGNSMVSQFFYTILREDANCKISLTVTSHRYNITLLFKYDLRK